MAVYKVPQDVEADDKLLGPFNFRQFVYLLIAAGLIAIAVGLAQLFPLLAIIPLPPVVLLLALALPLKKDQPMETYLAALVSFYIKPRRKVWMPGQKETTIVITAPKIIEDARVKDITSEEATHRLSFLANVVDTQGQAVRNPNIMRDDLAAEAEEAVDMFDERNSRNLQNTVAEDEIMRHRDALLDMQRAIAEAERLRRIPQPVFSSLNQNERGADTSATETKMNDPGELEDSGEQNEGAFQAETDQPENLVNSAESSIIELANNPDLSVATIAKEANRIKRKEQDGIFISLH